MTEKNKMGMSPEKAMAVYSSGEANNLKKIRVSKGLSQQELAKVSGIAKRVIQGYEQGERNIDHARLSNLCGLSIGLGVKIEDILESEELKELFKQSK